MYEFAWAFSEVLMVGAGVQTMGTELPRAEIPAGKMRSSPQLGGKSIALEGPQGLILHL